MICSYSFAMNYFNFCSTVMIVLALLFHIFRALDYKRKWRNGLDKINSINGIQVGQNYMYKLMYVYKFLRDVIVAVIKI